MDIKTLKHPNKSHRKTIVIPDKSAQLAELMGIELGDGGINNPWQIVITLNSISDALFGEYVSKLFYDLFTVKTATRKRSGMNAINVVATSTTLVDYFVEIGAIRGNKILNDVDIPKWIVNNPEYERACVRGLVDTDGCLYTHSHFTNKCFYINIGFCFASKSPKLLASVASILSKNGIEPHIKGYHLNLYSEASIIKYFSIFGSSNPRIYNKYVEWRGARVAEWASLERT